MSNHFETPPEATQPPLGKTAMVARLALIGAILAAALGTFAYLRGWLTPNVLTPARFVDGFEEVNGVHPGSRRNHAKGVGVSGLFESNGNGVRLSKAAVFQPGRVPVLGRFSLGGGQPLRARHGVRRARPGAPVLLAGRRAVANRDDPSAGVPVPHARSFLRAALRVQAGPQHGPARPCQDAGVSRPPSGNGGGAEVHQG